jgi:hypothetical protein
MSEIYFGFGMSNKNPIQYYVTNHYAGINIFDENWNYVSTESKFTSVFYILPAENYLYITGSDNIWKTDQQLNILIPFDYSNADFSGLYYNSTNSLIYVASHNFGNIHVFSLDLAFTDIISTSIHYPWSINGYNNNQLFVGTDSGTILVIVNNLIIQQFN